MRSNNQVFSLMKLYLSRSDQIVFRDCSKLNALALLSSAMALNFFQQLPLQLTQFIFTVEFLERVDKELRACYSRVMNLQKDFGHFKNICFWLQAVYPVKVRQLMMELNRAVCLDCPQADIPWFHEKYCQDNIVRPSNHSKKRSRFAFLLTEKFIFVQSITIRCTRRFSIP